MASVNRSEAEFFILRTPLLASGEVLSLADGLRFSAAVGKPEELESLLELDRKQVRARLRAFIERPAILEALYIASPQLTQSLPSWCAEPDSERGQRLERALMRYVMRMASRPTPFGLFAGCAVGRIGIETDLSLPSLSEYRRHTRIDIAYLSQLCQDLSQELSEHIRYFPNNTMYQVGGRLRYVAWSEQSPARSYNLIAVSLSPELALVIERARTGARRCELIESLCSSDSRIGQGEAADYVTDIIDSQMLVSALRPAVTGVDPLSGVLKQLGKLPEGASWFAILAGVQEQLRALDAMGVGASRDSYTRLTEQLSKLPTRLSVDCPVTVDLYKPSPPLTLGRAVRDEIAEAGMLLYRLERPLVQASALAQFCEQFERRYERSERPLVEVLDPELGIGFDGSDRPDAELSGLFGNHRDSGPAAAGVATWQSRDTFLLRRVQAAARSGVNEIVLDAADLQKLEDERRLPPPAAFSVLCRIVAESPDAITAGKYFLVMASCVGPSAAHLLGRFCHGDPTLREHVEALLREEEKQDRDALSAEVVYLPDGHIGNVVLRPLLREYEIPYLGTAGAPPERQLPITDLLVSVQQGHVVLRSARLGRRVIPRLTTAHNVNAPTNLSLYRFLGALQVQGMTAGTQWSWGPLAQAEYLPRVRHGRIVLARARWLLTADRLQRANTMTATERFLLMQQIRQELQLPRFVLLAEGDHELLLDLDNVLSVESFFHNLNLHAPALLYEALPGPGDTCVRGAEGSFFHELLVPVLRTEDAVRSIPVAASTISRAGMGINPAVRSFLPGSEWLFAKIYTGVATADQVLTEVVAPTVTAALTSGAATRWFFLRYADPEPHVRVRFWGAPRRLYGELLPSLHAAAQPLLLDGRIWRLTLDTYQREIERYGGIESIAVVEEIFQLDSATALAQLHCLQGDEGVAERWRLALLGCDEFLESFGADLSWKLAAATRLSAVRESNQKQRRQLAELQERYRTERGRLEQLLAKAPVQPGPFAEAIRILQQRAIPIAPLVARLQALAVGGQLTVPISSVVDDLAHLHINRLIRADAYCHELMIYDFLRRLYRSQVARTKNLASNAWSLMAHEKTKSRSDA